MPEIFFTSDLHLNHLKCAQSRGFNTEEEHDEEIIKNWNEVVKPKDTVYILGDVLFKPSNSIPMISRLNGIKHLVIGNHEHHNISRYSPYFSKIQAYMDYSKNGVNFILSHIPIRKEDVLDRWDINLHGHLHKKNGKAPKPIDSCYFNVNIELHNLRPIDFASLNEMIIRQKIEIENE